MFENTKTSPDVSGRAVEDHQHHRISSLTAFGRLVGQRRAATRICNAKMTVLPEHGQRQAQAIGPEVSDLWLMPVTLTDSESVCRYLGSASCSARISLIWQASARNLRNVRLMSSDA
jgi:hypothetical protein